MKSILFGLVLSVALLYSQAQEDAKPKEGEIKIYKRLIPADVLRGESIFRPEFVTPKTEKKKSIKSLPQTIDFILNFSEGNREWFAKSRVVFIRVMYASGLLPIRQIIKQITLCAWSIFSGKTSRFMGDVCPLSYNNLLAIREGCR